MELAPVSNARGAGKASPPKGSAPSLRHGLAFGLWENVAVGVARHALPPADRIRRFAHGASGHLAVITPAPHRGSVGDEAMLEVIFSRLRRVGARQVDLVLHGEASDWSGVPFEPRRVIPFNNLTAPTSEEVMRFLRGLWHYDGFLMPGADVIDGRYSPHVILTVLRLLTLAARSGADTRILGFSFSETPDADVCRAIGSLPKTIRLFARDPISRERLERVTGRSAEHTADLAFLLEPADTWRRAEDFARAIDAAREAGRVVCGVNVSAHSLRIESAASMEARLRGIAHAILEACRQAPRLEVFLIPHDFRTIRETPTEAEVNRCLLDHLSPQLGDRVHLLETRLGAAEYKGLAGSLDCLVTGRMHLAIAGLGRAVPTAGTVYQGKFEGLYQLVGLPPELLVEQAWEVPERLTAAMLRLVHEREALSARVRTALPDVQRLAERNLEGLGWPVQHTQ
jgi:polysaccharide pyruvyl transferase WcaK-like protein